MKKQRGPGWRLERWKRRETGMEWWKLTPLSFALVLLVRMIKSNCYHSLPSTPLLSTISLSFYPQLFVIQVVSLLANCNLKWYLNDFKLHIHHVGTSDCQIHKLRFVDDLNENM